MDIEKSIEDQKDQLVDLDNNKKQKIYRKKYYEENKDKWYKKEVCGICGGKYTGSNKTAHNDTKKHKKAVEKSKTYNIKINEGEEIIEKIILEIMSNDNFREFIKENCDNSDIKTAILKLKDMKDMKELKSKTIDFVENN
jgi:hypothetical protein